LKKPNKVIFMNPQFIVVTDRGGFRAGWIEPDPMEPLLKAGAEGALSMPPPGRMPVHRPARIRWVAELDFVHPRQHLVEQVTDLSGAYSAAASSAGAGGGAPRRSGSSPSDVHWRLEADRRAVADLVQATEEVLSREKPESWILSAPADIHTELEESLAAGFRQHLIGVIPKNLVHAERASLLEHFLSFRRNAMHTPKTDHP
jgi:hypothetical protein